MMMGRMSAIVPQLVPMANPMNAATRKMIAGSRSRPTPRPFRKPDILSSAGAKCNHLRHVATQIPYATLVMVVCFVGYIIAPPGR